MNGLLTLVCLVSLVAGAYFLIRLIIAAIRSQSKSNYLKGLIASVIVLIVSSVGVYQTRTPEQIAAHQAKIDAEKKAAEEKTAAPKELTPEEKAAKEAEKKAAEEKKSQEEAERQAKQKEFEEKQRQEQAARQIKEITTGWNLKTTDTDNDHVNWEKASDLVKKYPDYIHNAEANWISVEML